jgi:DNA polymerase V
MGFRTHEEEGALDGMSLDEYLISNKEATFMLRMRGDAMSEYAITNGDLLIVDKSLEPKSNDIVVIVKDGGFAVRPMQALPRSLTGDIRIEAVVTGIIRKF